mmetsp:Transcript_23045/g.92244  ORF Transcript_23045/g.92244 Transcript_23045/m.92244 type:complete len:200 (-) Transcript_23045:174-773(-)
MSLISESGMFAHAPISKALIMATAIGFGMKVSGASTVPFINSILSPFGFPRLLEVICAVFLLFVFRQLERQLSSRKFGAYIAIGQAATASLQYSLARATGYQSQSGPYGIIFSLLVLFYFEVLRSVSSNSRAPGGGPFGLNALEIGGYELLGLFTVEIHFLLPLLRFQFSPSFLFSSMMWCLTNSLSTWQHYNSRYIVA